MHCISITPRPACFPPRNCFFATAWWARSGSRRAINGSRTWKGCPLDITGFKWRPAMHTASGVIREQNWIFGSSRRFTRGGLFMVRVPSRWRPLLAGLEAIAAECGYASPALKRRPL